MWIWRRGRDTDSAHFSRRNQFKPDRRTRPQRAQCRFHEGQTGHVKNISRQVTSRIFHVKSRQEFFTSSHVKNISRQEFSRQEYFKQAGACRAPRNKDFAAYYRSRFFL